MPCKSAKARYTPRQSKGLIEKEAMGMSTLNPQRTIDELKELRALTGDENGAQRIAWTNTWAKARAWLRAKMEQIRHHRN